MYFPLWIIYVKGTYTETQVGLKLTSQENEIFKFEDGGMVIILCILIFFYSWPKRFPVCVQAYRY